MDFLVWLPTIVMALVIAFGCWVNQRKLFEIARAIQNQKAFSPTGILVPPTYIRPLPTTVSKRFEGPILFEAINQLKSYAESVKPDWILGVHPGGRLLSVLVADQMGFPKERCRFIRTTSHYSKKIVLEPETYRPNDVQGTMLVVDDISRTGNTLSVVKSFLIAKNYTEGNQLTRVLFSVLLLVLSDEKQEFRFRPDWVCYGTDNKWLELPWSDFSHGVSVAYRGKSSKREYDHDIIEEYDRIVADYDYALNLAKKFITG
jgi:hypoxanthine phosphoribosyltransferase